MYLKLAVDIIAALFAVFGIYSAVRLMAQKLFGSDKIFLCVEIKSAKEAENADILVREALSAFLMTSSCRVAMLVPTELVGNEDILRAIDVYGVECYTVDEK